MNRNPLTVRDDDSLSVAISLMAWAGIRHLPVMHQGRLTGMLSQRDVLAYQAHEHDWKSARVGQAMHGQPQFAGPDDSLTEVAGRLAVAHIGALPVMERGQLVGIITTSDVLAGEVQSAMQPRTVSRVTARDAMTPAPITVAASDRLLDAASIMAAHRIRHLPVVDDAGVPVGMLSERDLRAAIGDPSQLGEVYRATEVDRLEVGAAMSQPLVCVSQDEPLSGLAALFAGGQLGALLVVDDADHPVGMISYVDVLRSLRLPGEEGA